VNRTIKITLSVILIISMSFGSGILVSNALNNAPTYPVLKVAATDSPASFIINNDGFGWYWAVNGSTDEILWPSSNASYVFNTAIAAAHNQYVTQIGGVLAGGGRILVRQGIYWITNSIEPRGNVQLMGEGMGSTTLRLSPNVNCNMFLYNSTRPNEFFFEISNMELDGRNNAVGNGITILSNTGILSDVHINSLFIREFAQAGIYEQYSWGLTVTNSVIEYNKGDGVYVVQASGQISGNRLLSNGGCAFNGTVDHTQIEHNVITGNNKTGIYLSPWSGNNGAGNIISGNTIYNNGLALTNTNDGIWLHNVDSTIISSNTFDGKQTERRAITIDAGCDNTTIDGNSFVGNYLTYPIISDSGTGTIIGANGGYSTATPTPTPTPTGTPNPTPTPNPTTLFSDGFDTGTFSMWTGIQGTPTVDATVKQQGTYSAYFDINSETAYKTFPTSYNTINTRFYVRFSTLPTTSGGSNTFMNCYDSNWNTQYSIYVINSQGQLKWGIRTPTSGFVEVPATISPNTWYSVEVRATTGTGNGIVELYINGNRITNLTSETFTSGSQRFYYGAISVSYTGFGNYIDSVVIANSYIGP
jgi:hypothetical protein